MHAPSRLNERGASPETDARSLVTPVFAKPSRPGQVTTRVEFLGEVHWARLSSEDIAQVRHGRRSAQPMLMLGWDCSLPVHELTR